MMTMDKEQYACAATGPLILTGWLMPFRGERPGGTVWVEPEAGAVPVAIHATAPTDPWARWCRVYPEADAMRALVHGHAARLPGDRPVRVVAIGAPHPKTVPCPDCEGRARAFPCGRCDGEGRIAA